MHSDFVRPLLIKVGLALALGLSFSLLCPPQSNALTPLSNFEQGAIYFSQGDYIRALAPLRQSVANDALNVNARYYLAETLRQLGQAYEAQAQYRKIMQISPNSHSAKMSTQGLISLRLAEKSLNGGHWQIASANRESGLSDLYRGLIGEGPTYLKQAIGVNGVVRWSLLKPVGVWIEKSPSGIRNFLPGFEKQIRAAMDQWSEALGRQIVFELQDLPENAQIQIYWANSLDTQGHTGDGGTSYTAGLTIPNIRENQLKKMDVTIATFDISGNPQPEDAIYAVSLHELGHALGILGHSENADDVMYVRNHKVAKLSAGDIRTIRTLYAMPSDISNRPGAKPAIRTAESDRLAMSRVDGAIARLEKQSKFDGTSLSMMNLGVAYFQKGRLLEVDPDSKNPAQAYYEKSLKALNTAIAKEPRDAKPFHKRSLVHQAMKDYPAALSDIREAIGRNRKEPDYYMLQAWYLGKLKQPAEAQDSLNTYLLAKPSEKDSTEVQQIRKALNEK